MVIKLTEDEIWTCVVGQLGNPYNYAVTIITAGEEIAIHLKQQILDDYEKARKWDKYSKIIETILQLNKDFNTLTEYQMKQLIPKFLFIINERGEVLTQPLQNTKLRELIEKHYNHPDSNISSFCKELLQESKKW